MRTVLSKELAVRMLPDKEQIHTFRSGPGLMIGCDMSKADLLAAIEKHEIELSGKLARSMDHGMCLLDGDGWLFIETKLDELPE